MCVSTSTQTDVEQPVTEQVVFIRPEKKKGRPIIYNTPEEVTQAKRETSAKHYKEHYAEYKDVKNQKRREKRSRDREEAKKGGVMVDK